jgi:hypothetical protein
MTPLVVLWAYQACQRVGLLAEVGLEYQVDRQAAKHLCYAGGRQTDTYYLVSLVTSPKRKCLNCLGQN